MDAAPPAQTVSPEAPTQLPPVRAIQPAILIPLAIVTLIWGSTWLVIADQLGVVPPSWSVAYRFLSGALAMLAVAAWRRVPLRLDARGWGFAAMLGLAQFCLNFNFVYRAEAHITSGLVAVIFALLVIPNAILGRIFLDQRMGTQFWLGSLVSMAGVGLLMLHELRADASADGATLLGFVLVGCAVLSASVANVMQATETARAYPMATMLGWGMLLGVLFNALYALATVGAPVIEWRWSYLAGTLYLGIAGSAIAFTLYFGVIRVIGPAKAAYSGVAVPIIAMLLSTLFEGYRWSLLAGGGALLAMAGLVWALSARRPAR